jgi:hypothetical protein
MQILVYLEVKARKMHKKSPQSMGFKLNTF